MDFHGASSQVLGPRLLVVGSMLSFGAWGLELLAVYLMVLGVEADVPFLGVVFAFAVATIVGSLSLLPGGLGAAEASLAGTLRAIFGLAGGQAAAATLIVRLLTLWFAVLVGIAGLAAVRRLVPSPEAS